MRKRKKKRKCMICRKRIDAKLVIDGICKSCSSSSVTRKHFLNVSNRKEVKSTRKTCPNCGMEKELESGFGRRWEIIEEGHNWHRSWCKECHKKYNKQYREKNKEKVAVYAREYQQKNKEKLAAYMRKYRKKQKKNSA